MKLPRAGSAALVLIVCGAAACGSGSKHTSTSTSPTSPSSGVAPTTTAPAVTTTTKPATPTRPASIKTDCDLFTAAQLQQIFGVALKDGVESSIGCDYSLQQGAGQLTVSLSAKTTNPGYGAEYYNALARGAPPIAVAGAVKAAYAATTNPLGQVSEGITVLAKTGDSFNIQAAGDNFPTNVKQQMVTAAAAGAQKLNG